MILDVNAGAPLTFRLFTLQGLQASEIFPQNTITLAQQLSTATNH